MLDTQLETRPAPAQTQAIPSSHCQGINILLQADKVPATYCGSNPCCSTYSRAPCRPTVVADDDANQDHQSQGCAVSMNKCYTNSYKLIHGYASAAAVRMCVVRSGRRGLVPYRKPLAEAPTVHCIEPTCPVLAGHLHEDRVASQCRCVLGPSTASLCSRLGSIITIKKTAKAAMTRP